MMRVRRLANIVFGVLFAAILTLVGLHILAEAHAQADTSSHADPVFPRGLPWAPSVGTCYTYRCVWNDQRQGDGTGQSFIQTRYSGGYLAKPITDRRAHRLQAAWCARPNVTCRGYKD